MDNMVIAVDTMIGLQKAESETVRLKACQNLMDRALDMRQRVRVDRRLAVIEGKVLKKERPQ
jgi:hypothetical protein